MSDNNKIIGTLALSELKGIGPAFVKKAITEKSFADSYFFDEIKEITEANNKHFEDESIIQSIDKAKEILFKCEDEGIKVVSLCSQDYPFYLKEIKDPPSIIYCKGNLDLFSQKTIGIIGTREPNENGAKIAERLGLYFSENQWAICNGLVEGVDNFSIKHNGDFHNRVIGILAGGLNYSTKKTILKKTAENAEKTLENNGLLISEIQPDKKEDTFSIVKSCRIQAGISNGLILVQTSLDGGSKYTVKTFCEMSRILGVVNPFKTDIELPSYSANREIIINGKKGLAKLADIKEDKILTSQIFIIRSKNDYNELQKLINCNNK